MKRAALLLLLVAGGCTASGPADVTHREHARVPLAKSSACAVERARATVSRRSGPAGTLVSVSGPLYYLTKAGEVRVPSNDAIQAWWDLQPDDYASVGPQAVAAALANVQELPPDGPALVGDYRPNGACSFDLRFNVPDASRGPHTVSLVAVAGSDGSTTVYGSFTFDVREPQRAFAATSIAATAR